MKIGIIGRGNVAVHLKRALDSSTEKIYAEILNPHIVDKIPVDFDIYLIAVSDHAIADIVSSLPKLKGIVAHTSGSQPIEIIRSEKYTHYGVFYPLQTFSKEVSLNYSNIHFFIEGESSHTVETLKKLALAISKNVNIADSELRKQLHIASVISCNFVNHLWTLADDLLHMHNLSIDVLKPLINETVRKINETTPQKSQTGPARRGDKEIISTHLEYLHLNYKDIYDIYNLLSTNILNYYKTLPDNEWN